MVNTISYRNRGHWRLLWNEAGPSGEPGSFPTPFTLYCTSYPEWYWRGRGCAEDASKSPIGGRVSLYLQYKGRPWPYLPSVLWLNKSRQFSFWIRASAYQPPLENISHSEGDKSTEITVNTTRAKPGDSLSISVANFKNLFRVKDLNGKAYCYLVSDKGKARKIEEE